jgi:hypothetical protein
LCAASARQAVTIFAVVMIVRRRASVTVGALVSLTLRKLRLASPEHLPTVASMDVDLEFCASVIYRRRHPRSCRAAVAWN